MWVWGCVDGKVKMVVVGRQTLPLGHEFFRTLNITFFMHFGVFWYPGQLASSDSVIFLAILLRSRFPEFDLVMIFRH